MSIPRSKWENDPSYRRKGTRATLKFGLVSAAFYLATWGYRGDVAAACGLLLLRYGLLLFVMPILVMVWKDRWADIDGASVVWNCVSAAAATFHLVALSADPKLLMVVPCCTVIEALFFQRVDDRAFWQRLWLAGWWIGLPSLIQLGLYFAMR